MMKSTFLLSLLISTLAFSHEVATELDGVIEKSLNFVAHDQHVEDQSLYWPGEWSVNMKSYLLPALLGVGRLWAQPTQEPTSFATSSIVNLLSETYILNPQYKQILPMITKGIQSTNHYADGSLYDFYNWGKYNHVRVHAPKSSVYVPDFIRGLTNIPPDADTTSTTYMAKAYAQSIFHHHPLSIYKIPSSVLDTLSKYRDLNRTPHYYNYFDSIKNSGAFMTWFINEKQMTRNVFAPPDKGARVPFGFNDVDCVVNANVLRLLTATKNIQLPGYKESCELLNFVIEKGKQNQCGIYYPNSYAVFFTISNAYKQGASCLENSRPLALEFLLSHQNPDGSWNNEPGIGRTDQVQSTALALIALVNYTEASGIQNATAVQLAMQYLLSQRKEKSSTELYWDGEVFFSAVAQARNTVLWRSDSYTTSLVILALTKAQHYLEPR